MKYFLKMLEVAKRDGIKHIDKDNKNLHLDKMAMEKNFWAKVEKCEVFVFSPSQKQAKNLPDIEREHATHAHINSDGSTECPQCKHFLWPEVDAPFPVFSYEILNGNVTVPEPGEKFPTYMKCIMVWELEPKVYGYYALLEYASQTPLLPSISMVISTNTLGFLTAEMLKRLEDERDGIEKVREKIKIGVGDNKRFHTIRRIIHINPKSEIKEYENSGRKIDYSHRFSVRGHWRKLPGGLGKDREDNYCVADWTWVRSSIKGPEDKPLIRKTRVVG